MKQQQTFISSGKQLSREDLKKIVGGKPQGGASCGQGFHLCVTNDPCCEVACCSGGPDEWVSYCLIASC